MADFLRVKDIESIASLAAANLLPLAGVVLLGWDVAVILLLYWTENLIIGVYNVLKMALARLDSPLANLGKLFAIPFFCLHFGGFCAVHGLFLMLFLKFGGDTGNIFGSSHWPGHLIFLQLLVSVIHRLWLNLTPEMAWLILGLFISHGISFVQNYLRRGEYKTASIQNLMNQPYKRIMLLHITIIAGGLPVMMLGSPAPLLFALVGIKTAMDIRLHIGAHRQKSPQIKPGIGRRAALSKT